MPNNPSAAGVVAYITSNTTAVVWNVDTPANLLGDLCFVHVADSTGATGDSNSFTVASGNCPSATTKMIATQSQTTAQETSTALPGAQRVGVIIGGVIGGVLVLTIVGSTLWYQRRKRNHHPTKGRPNTTPARAPS